MTMPSDRDNRSGSDGSKFALLRRHPVVTTLLALTLLLTTTLAVFLATFDLNRYREFLQSKLSETLGRPVELGEARLSLRHGPAFYFSDLSVGEQEGRTWGLSADHLFLKLEFLPLLWGEVTFNELLLDGVRATVILPPAAAEVAPPKPFTLPKLLRRETPLVRSLKIRSGALHFVDRRDPQRPFAAALEGLEAEVTKSSSSQPTRLQLTGTAVHEGTAAPLALKGELFPLPGEEGWRHLRGSLELQLERFAPAQLLQRYAAGLGHPRTDGELSLQMRLNGSPAGGLKFEAKATGNSLTLHLPKLYREPLPLQQLGLSGNWTSAERTESFSGLALAIDDLSAEGAFALERRDAGLWLTGQLTGARLPLARLARFVPDRERPAALPWLKEHWTGGILEIESARLDGPLAGLRQFGTDFPLREAAVTVRDGALRLERFGHLRSLGFSARLEQTGLSVRNGTARLFDAPLRFAGTLTAPFGPASELRLETSAPLPAASLLALWPEERRNNLTVDGPLPLTLTAAGRLERLTFDLKADLQKLSVRRGEQTLKAAGRPGDLFLTGTLFSDRLELSHGRLRLEPLEVRARGSIARDEHHAFQINVDTAPLDLKEAWGHFPVLERAKVGGQVALQYEMSGADGKVARRDGTAFLRGFGLHLWGAVGDISDTSGQVRILTDRLEFEGLSAKVGTSPIRVSGALHDFAHPRLTLQVNSRAIRARDLIFPSPAAVLRDVDGRLAIDGDGIDFTRVAVRLDGGTQAVVQGRLSGFKQPRVELDITADKANIDEVIALWHHPPRAAADAAAGAAGPHEHKTTVRINARVREGVLGPLRFQNAEGVIGYADGVLLIQPLQFSAGQGKCTAQVSLEPKTNSTSLLKISGHMENFDAEALQTEVLKQRGLITGTLSGDFYLEGEPGERFLPTSRGGFSVKIKDGVLLQFKFLSKVFSILNVSQIFSLQLPDMAAEGMPFTRLKANLALREGILATDDLVVDSPAMNLSLVGESDLVRNQLDFVLGIKPLRTVDKIVTNIPIAGWILTGKEKALITVLFEIKGKGGDPEVTPMPISSVSDKVLGVFKRVFGLPGKVVTDVGELFQGEKK